MRARHRQLRTEHLEARYVLDFTFAGIINGYITIRGTNQDDTLNAVYAKDGEVWFETVAPPIFGVGGGPVQRNTGVAHPQNPNDPLVKIWIPSPK